MTKLPSVSIPEKLVADWKYILQAVARLPRKDPEDEKQSSAQKFNSMLKGYYNDIQAIWESYTSDRKKLGREAFTTRKNVVAYFAGFHLSNAARLTMLLQRLEQRSPQLLKTLRTNTLDIFDFGCGSGAGTQTFAEYVGVEQVESVILIDRSRAFLDLAKQVMARALPAVKSHAIRCSIESMDPPRLFEKSSGAIKVLQFGYVLNELFKQRGAMENVLASLEQATKEGQPAMVVVMEPANQYISREVMQFRDVVESMGWQVLYPCSIPQGQCPMLKRSRDWCYSETQWNQPNAMYLLDKNLGFDRKNLAVSGYIFVKGEIFDTLKPSKPRPVVVGRPTRSDNRHVFDVLLCDGEKLGTESSKNQNAPPLRGTFHRAGVDRK
jgi:ribosomal protein RSM22 (predicted rRNA methylase)